MPVQINDVIREKLAKFPADVCRLAVEAISLSETLPEESVAERLESTVRKLVRDRQVHQ